MRIKAFTKYRTQGRRCSWMLALVAACLFAGMSSAQTANVQTGGASGAQPEQVRTSELARQNLSVVAASAAQIKPILVGDPGLMVELKRWVAKDATDHGQIISESDLTESAIFDRLETDVTFRAAATQLLQQYGYLTAKVNPESPLAKQQELLIQERVKWITQDEEQERTRVQEQNELALEQQKCAQEPSIANCPVRQGATVGSQLTRQQLVQPNAAPGGQGVPSDLNPQVPNLPINNGSRGSLERASLTDQMGGQSGADLAMLGLSPGAAMTTLPSSSDDSNSAFSSLLRGSNQMGDLGSLDTTGTGGLGSMNGLFAGSGAMTGTDMSQMPSVGRLDTMSPAHPYATTVLPNQVYSTARFQSAGSVEPRMMRVASPYKDIPSLYDMYLQASPRPTNPKRFGSEVFENGTRDPQLIPMDLPAGPDYVVGPGDSLSIDLWGGVSQRLSRVVDREGRVSLPEVGPLLVSGKTLADVQEDLQRAVRTQFRDESAEVSISRLRTIRIYEVGDVQNPGAYDISSLSTPLNALFAAGGPTPEGSLRIVKHYRGNQLLEQVDLYDLLLNGVRSGVARLENGDTVVVPPVGPQVTVEGMVRRPAIYELKDEKTLSSVLELAGGLLPAATLRHIEVQRLVAHDKQTMMSLDIPETDDDAAVTQKLDAFQIHDGDRIRIYPIAPYNQDTVYLEGHVLRPGRYSYHENMRVSDVVASYKDLLPEPSMEYGEIVRLNAPDFHPSVESFSLSQVMSNPSASPVLHPMDTVRVFSKFDFENPPSVSVLGDVRLPGTYSTSGQIHLSDAVHLAGGLTPDARIDDAQVFRYLPDGKSEIFSVNLSAALAGDAKENILLETRDRLLIHKSPYSVEPGIVYVQGDVGKPGRYPLTTNMTVADLIRIGGGLKPSADTETADLTRYDYPAGGQPRLTGDHQAVSISAALSGDAKADMPVHNGDVLTIRELPGWHDLGASITLRGEVVHPGTYGIKPGERLSSVIQRAGGFAGDAYPYGSVMQRTQVRELEDKQQDELILRIKDAQQGLATTPDSAAKQTAMSQYETTLLQLESNPPLGRVALRISPRVDNWKNSSADIEARDGDILTIPKRPSYVMVTGQVYNPTAVAYRPGRSAKWYLSQSGGATALANKGAIFVVRADGSIIGAKEGLWRGDGLGATLEPGDAVVVPEKAIGGGRNWQALFTSAQIATSIVSTVFITLHY